MKIKNIFSKEAIIYPLSMVGMMFFFYFLQIRGWFSHCWGAIIPLVPEGLKGVLFSTLLHGNFEHLMGNSLPILVLTFLLFQFYPLVAKKVFFLGWILTGFLVWLLPPIDLITGEYQYKCIVGASGLVYVLAFFLFFSGVIRWNMKLLTVSLLVALYYGSLIWGVFPEEMFTKLKVASRISWQSHSAGAIIGLIMAFLFRKVGETKKKKFVWEYPNFYSEKDDKLWQEYIANHHEDFEEMPQKKEDDIWEHLDEIRRNEK